MVKILEFDSDRELGFNSHRSLWFDPSDGLWFNPDRARSFDHDRGLPFGKEGILFRGLQCSACKNVDFHFEERCTRCGRHYTQAEVTQAKARAKPDISELTPKKPQVLPARVISKTPQPARQTEPLVKPVPRVKPKVAARPVPPQPRVRKVAQPVFKVKQRPAPRPAPQPRQVHRKPPAARPKPPGRVRAQGEKAHCASCGVRVSLRHPYCWNCSNPIRPGGR